MVDLTKHSDLIAIVTIGRVKNLVRSDVALKKGQRQSAVAIADRVIKGKAGHKLHLTYEGPPLRVLCQPPSLAKGQFLVFLHQEGRDYVRTDNWYSQGAIVTNYVNLFMDHPVALESVIGEIESIVNVQSK